MEYTDIGHRIIAERLLDDMFQLYPHQWGDGIETLITEVDTGDYISKRINGVERREACEKVVVDLLRKIIPGNPVDEIDFREYMRAPKDEIKRRAVKLEVLYCDFLRILSDWAEDGIVL